MILADSSALIEFYRPDGNVHASEAVADAMEADEAFVNGIIQVEVLGFAPSQGAYRKLLSDFQAFRWLELTREDYDDAAALSVKLRGKGITIPATDLIIAANAMRVGARLIHLDSHYDQIARHSDLESENLGKRRR